MIEKLGAVAGVAVMWGGATFAQANDHVVDHDDIRIGLPVFVVALLATISCTWLISRKLMKREHDIDSLMTDNKSLKDRLTTLENKMNEME